MIKYKAHKSTTVTPHYIYKCKRQCKETYAKKGHTGNRQYSIRVPEEISRIRTMPIHLTILLETDHQYVGWLLLEDAGALGFKV